MSLYKVDSAGTLGYHQGELPDSRMMYHASQRGYELSHLSRKFKRSDFEEFDWIIAMDDPNYGELKAYASTVEEVTRIHRMVDFSKKLTPTHIPDPYYGGAEGFDHVIDLLEDACNGLFEHIGVR
jgi:protein-tyrosine phosphatase